MFISVRQIRFLLLIIVCVLLVLTAQTPKSAYSQGAAGNTCPALVAKAVQAVGNSCKNMGRNEACYGNTLIAATFQESAPKTQFNANGDITQLINLQALTTEPANPTAGTWGVAVMKVMADLPAQSGNAMTMVLFGDTQVTSDVQDTSSVPLCKVKNSGANANLYSGPGTDRRIVGVLAKDAEATANGRNSDGKWLRIKRANLMGWIDAATVAPEACSLDMLKDTPEDDVSALYTEPMQAFTLRNTTGSQCDEAPDGVVVQAPKGQRANVLVNGVQLSFGSSGFLNAIANGVMTVTGLEGQIDVSSFGKTVTILPGYFTTIPLAGLRANGQPSDPQIATNLRNLPRLLRDLVYGGTPSTSAPITAVPASAQGTVGNPVLVNVNFKGDASICPAGENKAPLDVVLVIDHSGSMSGGPLEAAKGAAISFIGQLNRAEDQVGLVIFNHTASVAVGLTRDFNRVIGAIGGLSADGGTDIGAGLATGNGLLGSSSRPNSRKSVVLFSDGASDPASARSAAGQIKNSGVSLSTIGLGTGVDRPLMSDLASTPADALFSPTSESLRQQFGQTASELAGKVAARNLVLTYHVNTKAYAIEKAVIPGGTVGDDVIEWRIPVVPDGKTINFPVVLRPLATGQEPAGTIDVSYLQCATGDSVSVGPLPAPVVPIGAPSDASNASALPDLPASPDGNFLAFGRKGTGTLASYGRDRWYLDVGDKHTIAVTVEGAGSSGDPQLGNNDTLSVQPLYILRDTAKKRAVTVYSVEKSGPFWLSIASGGPRDTGKYTLTVQDGYALDVNTLPALAPDEKQEIKRDSQGTIFRLDTKDEFATLEVKFAFGYASINIFDADMQKQSYLAYSFDYGTYNYQYLYQLKGKGPYIVVVQPDLGYANMTSYTITAHAGDLVREKKGALKLGQKASGALLASGKQDLWTFQGEAGQIIRLDAGSPQLYVYAAMTDSTGKFITTASNGQPGIVRLKDSGTYNISIQVYGYARGGNYALTVDEATLDKPGELRYETGTAAELAAGKKDSWTFKGAAGDTVSIALTPRFGSMLELRDESGKVLASSSNGGVALTRIEGFTLPSAGTYTVTVAGANDKATGIYQLIVNKVKAPAELAQDKDVSATLDSGARDLWLLNGEEGDTVTVRMNSRQFTPFLEIVGPDGSVVATNEGYSTFALLTNFPLPRNGKYLIVAHGSAAGATGDYTLNLKVQPASKGSIPPGETVSGSGNNLPIAYTFDGKPGQTVSVVLNTNFAGAYPVLSDAESQSVIPQNYIKTPTSSVYVYPLTGTGPYRITFRMSGSYKLTVAEGDVSRVDKGALALDTKATDTIKDFARLVVYKLDLAANDTVSLQLTTPSSKSPVPLQVSDARGNAVTPEIVKQTNTSAAGVYILRGAAPFTVSFPVEGNYTLTASKGDILRSDKGPLTIDQKVSGMVAAPAQFAVHTFEGKAGQFMSLQLESPRLITSMLKDADGHTVAPQTRLAGTGTNIIEVYLLSGASPYTLTLETQGNYAVTVKDGDISQVKQAEIAPGKVVSTQLSSAQRAAYPLNVKEGDEITVSLSTARKIGMKMWLLDSQNNVTPIGANADAAQNWTYTVTPKGQAPFTLLVQLEGRHDLTVLGKIDAAKTVAVKGKSTLQLRGGPAANASTVGSAPRTDELTAVGRSSDGKSLVVITSDKRVVWVAAAQVDTVQQGADLSALPVVG